MNKDKKQEDTGQSINLASKTTYLPAIKPSGEVSLAKEFSSEVIKAFSNKELPEEDSFINEFKEPKEDNLEMD